MKALNCTPLGVLVKNEEGTKLLPYADILNLIKVPEEVSTPVLPENCIAYTQQRNVKVFAMQFDPCEKDVLYQVSTGDVRRSADRHGDSRDTDEYGNHAYDIVAFKIHVPYMIHIVKLINMSGNTLSFMRSLAFSSPTPVTSPEQPLYRVPFGNVYNDGSVCWGGNPWDVTSNLFCYSSVNFRFFGLPFNADLDSSESYKHSVLSRIMEEKRLRYSNLVGTIYLFNQLSQLDYFPNEILNSSGHNFNGALDYILKA